ncbi:hypothetical protein [Actinophytocola oryzae]|uniref:Uncharacterized protein n=1 Tax=Actinophytocola oryzae TaxID=502181 RepID=A0A4R7W354_9PSEU|nr:hypothetical protein [Actinophytocola oryzae]TDV56319.1 hypothetical protein CLV71_102385 [Actinophytocola oryzae]
MFDVVAGDVEHLHNPGISVHWEGPWASGFPVVDQHTSDWTDDLLKTAAEPRSS